MILLLCGLRYSLITSFLCFRSQSHDRMNAATRVGPLMTCAAHPIAGTTYRMFVQNLTYLFTTEQRSRSFDSCLVLYMDILLFIPAIENWFCHSFRSQWAKKFAAVSYVTVKLTNMSQLHWKVSSTALINLLLNDQRIQNKHSCRHIN